MEVTETITEGLKREFKVVIAAAEIDSKVDERLKEIAPTLQLPGFRPGKVPATLVKKRFGQSLLGEVLEKSVNESSQQALDERGLRPAGQPNIEVVSFDEGKELEFNLSVELMPEIEPLDYSVLKLKKLVAEANEKDIDDALSKLAEQHKGSEPISSKRASKIGDILVIDFVGSVDGEKFDGGSAEGHHLELGSNQFIPGFEEQLVGKKAGASVKVEVKFPENYSQANLSGKNAFFDTKIKEIRQSTKVKIDDDFAKLFGLEELSALRDALKTQIEQELEQTTKARLKRELLDKLEDVKPFDVPQSMSDQEYASICQAVKANEENANTSNLDQQENNNEDGEGATPVDESLSDDDKKEYRQIAERRVRLALVLQEVGRLNNIEVSDEEVQRALFQEASRYPGQEKQIMELYQKNPQAMASIRAPLYEDKIVDFITEMAEVSEKKVTRDELLAEPANEEVVKPKETKKKKVSAKKAPAKKVSTKKTIKKAGK
ncbi:MAG: trigger factor [Pseudomonadota bacterium]|nr:trigger factor [Pseudomonadota bacterium]